MFVVHAEALARRVADANVGDLVVGGDLGDGVGCRIGWVCGEANEEAARALAIEPALCLARLDIAMEPRLPKRFTDLCLGCG